MTSNSVSQTIMDAGSTWESVTITPHRFGGIKFRVGNRDGHLHGSYQASIPFEFNAVGLCGIAVSAVR